MSAEDVGQKLLAEVEEESLSEIFDTIRLRVNQGHITSIGFTAFDFLLDALQRPRYNATHQQGQRQKAIRPPCIELSSPHANGGKSQLLYLHIACMILPGTIGNVSIEGQHGAVLYFDAGGHFTISRLVQIMKGRIFQAVQTFAGDKPADEDVETVIVSSLQNLHVFCPQSMTSLIATLEGLPSYLYSQGRHFSTHRKISALVLDSATAFFWTDRNDAEVAKIMALESGKSPAYTQLRTQLSKLSQELSCPVIYTASNLFHHLDTERGRALPSSLPKSWSSFPTLRLIMKRREVRGLPTAISAEEAFREAGDRASVVAEGLFDIVVNEDGMEDMSNEMREALRQASRRKVTLRINNEVVKVEA